MMDSIYDIMEAFLSATENLTLLEDYKGFDGECDILPEEDYIPKPQKNLFRKGYSEPTFQSENAPALNCGKKPEDFHGNLCYDVGNEKSEETLPGFRLGLFLLAEVVICRMKIILFRTPSELRRNDVRSLLPADVHPAYRDAEKSH